MIIYKLVVFKGADNQKFDLQKKFQSILQANEINNNLNNLLYNGKNSPIDENKQLKKEFINQNQDISVDLKKNVIVNSRTQSKNFSNNDENNFKGTLSNKINSLLLKSQKKLSNSKQTDSIGEPISPSSISSSSSSSLSSSTLTTPPSVSSSSCKIINLSEQQIKVSPKYENSSESLDLSSSNNNNENNQNSKSDILNTIDLKPLKKNESDLEEISKDNVESFSSNQVIKEEDQEFNQYEDEVEKTEETLVIDEHVENDCTTKNDVVNEDDLKSDKQTSDDSQLLSKEILSGDLNNSKSSNSTNENLSTLCSKVNSRDKHVCRFCSKSFPRSANLTRHLRTHTGT